MATEQVMVTMPPGLSRRAQELGINVSGTATKAVLRSVQALEKGETGVESAKTAPGCRIPLRRALKCQHQMS